MWGRLMAKRRGGWLTKEFLEIQYVTLKKSASVIAREEGVSSGMVIRRLKQHEIPLRSKRESIQLGLAQSGGSWRKGSEAHGA